MRKNLLKVCVPRILEFVRKIVICSSSHILGIDLQSSGSNSFQKNKS
ncbi:hypothetical protein LEP1GSC172_3771 [Leptospira noguchii]|uniref:Uncharacterized protein n=2 Tax=Leptospira noguchii TaxID=28182 RepID=T0FTL6_9LEPT|nr:hypothetical protein LEP1GSC172_3771 [Leptospira noguchii]EQA73584.1 hypothetical protein LEP1GSC059_2534 [Leptospira noguchii serovar Panama str. CZ214]